jgi:hypothetical protein
MKANRRIANSPPRGQLPLPAEGRRPNAECGSDRGVPPFQALPDQILPRPLQEDGEFREYYRLR